MDNQDFEILASGYVLGALSEEEQKRFEQAATFFTPAQKKLLGELQQSVGLLAVSVDVAQPSSRVKEELFRKIRAMEFQSKNEPLLVQFLEKCAGFFRLDRPVFALVVSTILLSITIASILFSQVLFTELQTAQRHLVLIESEHQSQQRILNVLYSPELAVADLGSTTGTDAYGKVMWCQKNHFAVVQVANLAPITNDKDFQLWIIKPGISEPVDAGVFSTRDRRYASVFIEKLVETNPENIAAFAISIEPKGGMAQPTGDIVLVGAL